MGCATRSTRGCRGGEVSGSPLLSVQGLSVSFDTEAGNREVLRDVSFEIAPGEVVGIVGESGSGKSVTALAIMQLLGAQGMVTRGGVLFRGHDLLLLDARGMRGMRGRRISMIFQEPMTSLNPLYSVGFQVAEVLEAHLGMTGAAARKEVIGWFERVGIPNPDVRFDEYPHVLSGGMRQRVMIAMAMACRPALLIADEPTTALDVTIQAQILALMDELRREHGTAIMLITHDMGVIARMAQRVVVMYAGEVAEVGTLRHILSAPAHPYTRLLLAAMPTARRRLPELPVIPGVMPTPGALPHGCRFHPRCPAVMDKCRTQAAPLLARDARQLRCWLGLDDVPSPSLHAKAALP
jgi:oligopeptide/dipeptide ABC transporter ATP-binding protein